MPQEDFVYFKSTHQVNVKISVNCWKTILDVSPDNRNLPCPIEGSFFTIANEDIKKFCDEKSKFDVNISFRNLKEEAKDDDEESGVSDAGPPRQPRMPRIGPCQVLAATLTLSQPGGGGGDYAYPILGSLAG